MNTLNLIRDRIERAERRRQTQLSHVAYRGTTYEIGTHNPAEHHGTFVYRGHVYTKWVYQALDSHKGIFLSIIF